MEPWNELEALILGGGPPAAGYTFLLAAARAAGLLLVLPGWSSRLVPLRFRWAFAILLALVTARPAPEAASSRDAGTVALLLPGELLLGAALGWGTLLVIGAVKAAGSFIADQIGLSLGGVMDPLDGASEPALRGFLALFVIHIFLSLDFHHAVLRSAAGSFATFPAGSFLTAEAFSRLAQTFVAQAEVLGAAALAMAFPVTAALLLASLVQGIASRVFPQMEFLLFGFPARAVTGLVMLALSLPYIAGLCEGWFEAVTGAAWFEVFQG
jgi:flagellar biosynthetic protein FliR